MVIHPEKPTIRGRFLYFVPSKSKVPGGVGLSKQKFSCIIGKLGEQARDLVKRLENFQNFRHGLPLLLPTRTSWAWGHSSQSSTSQICLCVFFSGEDVYKSIIHTMYVYIAKEHWWNGLAVCNKAIWKGMMNWIWPLFLWLLIIMEVQPESTFLPDNPYQVKYQSGRMLGRWLESRVHPKKTMKLGNRNIHIHTYIYILCVYT